MLTLLWLSFVGAAWAGPIDRFGAGPGTVASGGLGSLADDALAQFTLPTWSAGRGNTLSVAVRAGASTGAVRLSERLPSHDIPEAALTADVASGWTRGWRALPTGRLRPRGAAGAPAVSPQALIGATWALGDAWSLGVAAALPLEGLQAQRAYFVDEREQAFSNQLHWRHAAEDQQRLETVTVVTWSPTDWLALAAGGWVGQRVRSNADVYISSLEDTAPAPTNVSTAVETVWTPTVGLRLRGPAGLRVRLAWQGQRDTGIVSTSRVRIRGLDDAGTPPRADVTTLSLGQVPMRLATEVTWHGPVALAAGATWHRTSALTTPHHEAVSGGLNDVVALRLGARAAVGEAWVVRGGLAWLPTGVPEQTGRTNVVDNDMATVSAGLDWQRAGAFGQLRFSLAARVSRLVPRTHTKRPDARDPVFDEWPDATDPKSGAPLAASQGLQTNNPGFPGFESEAWVGAVTLGVTLTR